MLFLLALIGFGAVYDVTAALILRRQFTERKEESTELPPVTLLRPIKPGVPDLAKKLVMLAEASRPGDQIVLGVDNDADAETGHSLARDRKDREIVVVRCLPGGPPNLKIAKLLCMSRQARHPRFIVTDCEALITSGFLTAFRSEWLTCDVLTAGYRFENGDSWPQRLDAMATLLTFWPGLAVCGRQPLDFTLGACTALQAADLAAVGGWERFGEFLAEDNQLGHALADAGKTIRLSRWVLALDSDDLSWSGYFAHQHRAAFTYRVCSPAGFGGMIFCHGISWAVVWVAGGWSEPWRWVALVSAIAVRIASAMATAKTLGFTIRSPRATVVLASLAETIFWLAAWLPLRVGWGGRKLRVDRRGVIVPDQPSRPN